MGENRNFCEVFFKLAYARSTAENIVIKLK